MTDKTIHVRFTSAETAYRYIIRPRQGIGQRIYDLIARLFTRIARR